MNLSTLSKDFYEKVEVKKRHKWKKVLEAFETLTKNSKLEIVSMAM
jgi:uncharacterized protein (DUF2249 family)